MTVFEPTKVTRQRRGYAVFPAPGAARALHHQVTGYQIHHGRVTANDPWIVLDDAYGAGPEGSQRGRFSGTTLHGVFEDDGFRAAFLGTEPSGVSFAAAREAQLDRLADMLEAHLDLAAVEALIKEGAPAT
jgi:adenosylcobyric acid synthase